MKVGGGERRIKEELRLLEFVDHKIRVPEGWELQAWIQRKGTWSPMSCDLRVNLHKLLEMILGLVFILLSSPVLTLVSKWDFSGSFFAAVPNLQPFLTMCLSPRGVPSSLCTSTFHHLSSPASSPQTFPNFSNAQVYKHLLPIRDPIQLCVWLLCFSILFFIGLFRDKGLEGMKRCHLRGVILRTEKMTKQECHFR